MDSPDVELLSCRLEEGSHLLRLANTCDHGVRTLLGMARPITAACITTLAGVEKRALKIKDGRAVVPLRPWDVRQVKVMYQ